MRKDWVDLSAGLIFFVIGIFLSEKVYLKKKSNGNAPPSLTKDSIFFHWQLGRIVPINGW
jgi:hypothetical protein